VPSLHHPNFLDSISSLAAGVIENLAENSPTEINCLQFCHLSRKKQPNLAELCRPRTRINHIHKSCKNRARDIRPLDANS